MGSNALFSWILDIQMMRKKKSLMIINRDRSIKRNFRRMPKRSRRINLTLIKMIMMTLKKKISSLQELLLRMLRNFRIKRISLRWASKPPKVKLHLVAALEKSLPKKMPKQLWLP
jgi:hypothetical protein